MATLPHETKSSKLIQDALDAAITEAEVCETAWHNAAPGTSAESIAWGKHRFAQGYVVGLRVTLALMQEQS